MFCKSIAKKYCPHVGEIFPYDGIFTWKGYYLSTDGRTFHGVSFSTKNQFLSDEEKNRILNAHLVKRERDSRLKAQMSYRYINNSATTWGTFTTYTIT